MTRRIFRDGAQDRWLATLLKSAAEAERPAFSPELHERIMRRVVSAESRRGCRPEPSYGRPNLHLWVVTVVGVCCAGLLTVWLAGGLGPRDSRAPGVAGEKVASRSETLGSTRAGPADGTVPTPALGRRSLQKLITAPDLTAEQVKTALQELEERRWASLDHDLLVAGELLKKQIPLGLVAHLRDRQAEKLP